MRFPKLDFIEQQKDRSRLGLLLLGFGVLLLLSVWFAYGDTQAELAQQRTINERLLKSVRATGTIIGTGQGTREPHISGLLLMLEKNQSSEIRFLELETNAISGMTVFKAQASSAKTMLDFLASLREQAGVRDLALIGHRSLEGDSSAPFEFSARLVWRTP
jgi:hypothetical protein